MAAMNQQQQQQGPVQNHQNSIYVGNIAWKTTEQEIGDTFANFGYVNSVKIITDKDTGRSKGFGFVEFSERAVIPAVISQMNGYTLNGRQLRVNQASGVNKQGQMQGGPQGGNQFQHQQQQFMQQQNMPMQQQQPMQYQMMGQNFVQQ